MRKGITAAFISVDGVMQAPGGPEENPTGGFKCGGRAFPYVDDVFGNAIDELFNAPFNLLLGRKTYEIFAAYWSYQSADLPTLGYRCREHVPTKSVTHVVLSKKR